MDDDLINQIEFDISEMYKVAFPMNGNCGIFAVALSLLYPGGEFVVMRDSGFEYHKDTNGNTFFEHVAYAVDGIMFDGQGQINEEYLTEWSRKAERRSVGTEITIERWPAATQRDLNAIMRGCNDDGTDPEDYLAAILTEEEIEVALESCRHGHERRAPG